MSQTSQLSELKHFALDCLRLLYWTYFKPYTLRRRLRTIHPDLDNYSNPFTLRSELDTYPDLDRYAEHLWWTIALTPWAAMLLVASLYTWVALEPFDFIPSIQFLSGWLVGNWIARSGYKRFVSLDIRLQYALFLFLIVFGALFLFLFGALRIFPDQNAWLLSIIPAAINDFNISFVQGIFPYNTVAFGVIFGVIFGVTFGVASVMAVGVAFVVAAGVAGGVVGGAAVGVAFIVAGGAAGSVEVGAAVGIAFGMIFNVFCLFGMLRVYFWLPELLWSLLVGMISLTRRGEAHRWLGWLPFWYDELIYLPLPFQSRIIAESFRSNPSLARQAIDYLSTSTNQQKAAAAAIVRIAVERLERCRTVEEMRALSTELAWIPTPPPRELDALLPRFIEVSRSVAAAQEATSPYRRHELLAAPIRTLEQMKEGLVFGENARLAPRYGGIVERWLGLLQSARRVLAEEAEQSNEIPQVYVAGPSLEPENAGLRFKGRQDIFREIESLALANQPPVLLFHGGRRTGKTSALKYLPQRVGPEIVPLLVDMQGGASATSLTGMAERFATDIVAAARQARNLHLPYPDNLGKDPFPTLLQWMAQVERTAPGKRFLLCLDEYERLSEVVESTGSRAPLNFLRHIIQHNPRWIVLFSGSHTLEELPAYWMDYLINSQALRVSYLAESEARELIEQPIPNFPAIYTAEVVDEIVQLTRCQPYLVQLTCSVLVDRLNREQCTLASLDDLHAAIPIIFERGAGHFLEFWRTTLTEAEQTFLLAFVAGTPIEPIHTPLLAQLARKEVLERTNGAWRFQVPLMRRYVEQRLSEV